MAGAPGELRLSSRIALYVNCDGLGVDPPLGVITEVLVGLLGFFQE